MYVWSEAHYYNRCSTIRSPILWALITRFLWWHIILSIFFVWGLSGALKHGTEKDCWWKKSMGDESCVGVLEINVSSSMDAQHYGDISYLPSWPRCVSRLAKRQQIILILVLTIWCSITLYTAKGSQQLSQRHELHFFFYISPLSRKSFALIPHPTTRACSLIEAPHVLSGGVPRFHGFRDDGRVVLDVSCAGHREGGRPGAINLRTV